MPSVNRVVLIGVVACSPKGRYLLDGSLVVEFVLATDEVCGCDPMGESLATTELHNICLIGGYAEHAQANLQIQQLLYVEGSIRTNKRLDELRGQCTSTYVRATKVEFLDGARDVDLRKPFVGIGDHEWVNSTGYKPLLPALDSYPPVLAEPLVSPNVSAAVVSVASTEKSISALLKFMKRPTRSSAPAPMRVPIGAVEAETEDLPF